MGISLEKMQQVAPDLVKKYEAAGVSLRKLNLDKLTAAVYLVLDHSGSMEGLYNDGTVQHFTEQVLGLSARLDDDGVVPVVFFHGSAYEPFDVRVGQHQNAVNRLRQEHHVRWGGTSYAPAMEKVVRHYQQSGATDPALVIFETDGACADPGETQNALRSYAKLPLFWQFVGFGSHNSPEFSLLRGLDNLRGRVVDNAGFFGTGHAPRSLSDEQIYDGLTREFATYLPAARAAGVAR